MQRPSSITVLRRFLVVISLVYLASRFGWKPVALTFGAFVFLFVLPLLVFSIKKSFLQATEPQELRAAKLDEFARLSHAAWNLLAQELETLGFEPRGVWVVNEKHPRLGTGVIQLFEHPQHGVLGEISQTFTPKRVLPLVTILVSYWGDADELKRLYPRIAVAVAPIASPLTAPAKASTAGEIEVPVHSYSTHNRAPNWILNLLSHPKLMGSYLIGASPSQILTTHLSRRESVSRALNEVPVRHDLAEVALAHSRALSRLWHQNLRTKPFVPALWRAFRKDRKAIETFGALEPAIAALKPKTDA